MNGVVYTNIWPFKTMILAVIFFKKDVEEILQKSIKIINLICFNSVQILNKILLI